MVTFFELWTLLEPKAEYANLFHHCRQLWYSWTPEKQEEVFLKIEKKKTEKKKTEKRFVDYNPLLALRNNAVKRPPRRQTLSYAAYYAKYGTTEEHDGWVRTFIPEEQRTVYVKAG